ncbi:POK10 protein, partial [Orthonyx spaldingii]|nr:POK10 protein [Orthonyx spaldingii]
ISKGNAHANPLAGAVVVPDVFPQAHLLHEFFHQSAATLQRQFHLTHNQEQQIVQACANCQQVVSLLALGVNPQGLQALEIWQTDVAHFPEFGRLKYVHVTIDTFSTYVFASAH